MGRGFVVALRCYAACCVALGKNSACRMERTGWPQDKDARVAGNSVVCDYVVRDKCQVYFAGSWRLILWKEQKSPMCCSWEMDWSALVKNCIGANWKRISVWSRWAPEQCVLLWSGEKGEFELEDTPKVTRGKESRAQLIGPCSLSKTINAREVNKLFTLKESARIRWPEIRTCFAALVREEELGQRDLTKCVCF